ncbi:MAG: hypothetical protein U9O55_01665 [Patescibacteria group bacterium]|nr:hypothetical protein [Patescibacteria group bacterium]
MNYKKIITIFLFTFIFQCFLFSANLVQGVEFTPSVPIPGVSDQEIIVESDFSTLTDYIANFYKFAIGLTGILAVIMVTAGGMVWLTAGGSATQIGKAKQMIMGSIAGLLLALFSYTLLYSINPDIVNMKIAGVKKVKGIAKVGCRWEQYECKPATQEKASDSYCGQKPQIDEEDDPNANYCCCMTTVQGNQDYIDERCAKECPSGYEYDFKADKCNCFGEGQHTACVRVDYAGAEGTDSIYECQLLNFAGEDMCDINDPSSCKRFNEGCCLCSWWGITNCKSGSEMSSESACKDYCGILAPSWKYTINALCADNKCVKN